MINLFRKKEKDKRGKSGRNQLQLGRNHEKIISGKSENDR